MTLPPDGVVVLARVSLRGVILSWVERKGPQATLKFSERTAGEWSTPRTIASRFRRHSSAIPVRAGLRPSCPSSGSTSPGGSSAPPHAVAVHSGADAMMSAAVVFWLSGYCV